MITDLRLQNFRTYNDNSFELDSSVNIIIGPNASGKTSLLEAILILAGHNTWRSSISETIKFNSDWARLDTHTKTDLRTTKITHNLPNKTFEINNKIYKRLSNEKKLPVCLFEPNHLLILSGNPEKRRDYIDNLAEQTIVGFSVIRRQYHRSLAQRNKLLKQNNNSIKNQLFSWNIRLSELAGQIINSRVRIIEEINQSIKEVYQTLASNNQDDIAATYVTKLDINKYETSLLKNLENNYDEEVLRGFTLFGPHRDDIQFTINQKNSSVVASRGEARTITLALKIIEAKILEKYTNQQPIMLLDDVFSELDGQRRQQLTKHLKNYQTFITTTDADLVLQHFTNSTHIIPTTKN